MIEDKKLPFDHAVDSLPEKWISVFQMLPKSLKDHATEIRFRTGRPVSICTGKKSYYLTQMSTLTEVADRRCVCVNKQEMEELVLHLSGYSLHSHQSDFVNGFLTVKGGHRIGLSGSAVTQNGKICSVKQISSINLRISREVKGCAQELIRRVFTNGLANVLVAGSPASGKTTLIRDAVRLLSKTYQISVIDERSEIASMIFGTPQNDVGPMTDILDGYPKSEGIIRAVRSLSPDLIVCDEIGSSQDIDALATGTNSGVHILATIHAANMEELMRKPLIHSLLERGSIDYLVFLSSKQVPGKIESIIKVGEYYAQMDREHLDYRLVRSVRPDPVELTAKTCSSITNSHCIDG